MKDGGARVVVGRVMLLSAVVLAVLGVLFLVELMPVAGGSAVLLGVVLLSAAAVDAVLGVKFLVSHTR